MNPDSGRGHGFGDTIQTQCFRVKSIIILFTTESLSATCHYRDENCRIQI